MNNYIIVNWPEIQEYMLKEGFRENSTLINMNENIGIGSSTYLISRDWVININNK